jgi:hypothetical protein
MSSISDTREKALIWSHDRINFWNALQDVIYAKQVYNQLDDNDMSSKLDALNRIKETQDTCKRAYSIICENEAELKKNAMLGNLTTRQNYINREQRIINFFNSINYDQIVNKL